MAEYIEREALLAKVRPDDPNDKYEAVLISDVKKMVRNFVNSVPPTDVAQVRHGCTVPAEQPKNVLLDRKCGICDSLMLSTDVYCPNCGARMVNEF